MMQQQDWQQQQQWSQQLRASGLGNKSPLTIDAIIPSEQHAQQVVQQYSRDESVKAVEFRRDNDGTPHVRIQLRADAHPSQFREKLQNLTQAVEQSYTSATSRFSG